MSLFICSVCGHLEFNQAPENCPVCFAAQDNFKQNDSIFTEAKENASEAAVKHVPTIKVNRESSIIPEGSCIELTVRVGETLHPMQESHMIQFLDCYVDGKYVTRVLLTPDAYPAAVIQIKEAGSKVTIVESCNLHGYWMSDVEL